MPKQKDLKRLIRSRMEKTGEAYTAARAQLLNKNKQPDYAAVAGMSDASVQAKSGKSWAEWVRLLDAAGATEKPHRDIVALLSAEGLESWWAQMVTVGYERVRGLRERGQRREGTYEANKSRTFAVPVERLFEAFTNARLRKKWLDVKVTVRSATPHKYVRMIWDDGTPVQVGFLSKGDAKSSVAIQHEKLPDKAAAAAIKTKWSGCFDRLHDLLSS